MAMCALPLGGGPSGVRFPIEAADVATDLLRRNDCLVRRYIIAHRAFDAELARVAVHDDQDKGAAQRSGISPPNRQHARSGRPFTAAVRLSNNPVSPTFEARGSTEVNGSER